MTSDSDKSLNSCRVGIDQIDGKILDLMNQRLTIAKEIGRIKQQLDQPAFYRPERESQVLRRLKDSNIGPMEPACIESLFREIMSITRGTEAGFSASLLGPAGTFSEAATLQHFGSTIDLIHCSSIDDIFRSAETGQTNFAVVPVENSTEGGVGATLDRISSTSLRICGEIYLRVNHNLITQAATLGGIKSVIAHPQALGQCRHWLNLNLPGIEQIASSSNSEGVVRAGEDAEIGAIAANSAAEKYGIKILATNIEDEPGNTTRFLVLSDQVVRPSGDDKTSLMISARNRPGALYHLLQPLADEGLDMTKIESRPSPMGNWDYVFYIDIKGHIEDPVVARAIAKIKGEAGLFKHLGSYPASI